MSRIRVSPVIVLIATLLPGLAFAAGTPVPGGGSSGTTPLIMQQGGGATTPNGDYISAGAGLNATYRYWVEVPPGTGALTIEYFDIDQGTGGGAEATAGRDRARSGFNTGTFLNILNPAGTSVASATLASGSVGGCDNAWCAFGVFPIANPAAGHWEVVISNANSVTGGDDIAAVGLRAHDGTVGAGGTELNIYAESFFTVGVNNSVDSRSYSLYPYVSSGCTFQSADFDWDANATSSTSFSQPYGSLQLDNRSGTFTHNNTTMSNNNAWQAQSVTGYTTDSSASGYGLWDETVVIQSYAAGNYGVNYFRAFNADGGEPPPSAQPENNTYRIYFPSDGNGTPVKTYVEQLLTHVSGPNPPLVGQVTGLTVSVRVVNPEASAVTFSTPTNVVTANVPGGQVVYAGSAAASQGTITAQPSVGGSGNVVWNPGSVAAGATALLTYQLSVTPAVAGTRIPVTGTPASNGTSAQFVDHTGNTSQARATYNFGPVCELAVTEGGTPTLASVVNFQALRATGGVALVWETASEVGTASFEVQRETSPGKWDSVAVTSAPSSLESEAGAYYQVFDPVSISGGNLSYRVIERESRGRVIQHGPFEVAVEDAPERVAVSSSQTQFSNARSAPQSELDRIAIQDQEAPLAEPLQSVPGSRWARVSQQGMQRISVTTLADSFGISTQQASQRLSNQGYQLSLRGIDIPWFEIDGGLAFYGEQSRSLYSDRTNYLLSLAEADSGDQNPDTLGAKSGASSIRGVSEEPTQGIANQFMDTLQFELDVTPVTALADEPADDYWYWKPVVAGNPNLETASFDFALPDLADPAGGRILVNLMGASSEGIIGEHLLEFRVNGVLVHEARWTGFRENVVPLQIPDGLFSASGNTLSVSAQTGNNALSNIVWIDGFGVTFPRQLRAENERLEFTVPSHMGATVDGFSSDTVHVFDLTSVRSPIPISGIVEERDGGYSVTVVTNNGAPKDIDPSTPGRDRYSDNGVGEQTDELEEFSPGSRYLAFTNEGLIELNQLDAVAEVHSSALGSGADWLVIAPQSLMQGAQALADYRSQDGFETKAISTEAIYSVFSNGNPDPEAIRSFLEYTQTQWAPAPRYVLLAGRGTFDHRNIQGHSDHLLTPMYVTTQDGLAGADPRFADFGDLGLPAIAIGRIPAVNNAELLDYREKLRIYERTRPPIRNAVAVLADDLDVRAGDFATTAAAMSEYLPAGYTSESYYLDEITSAEANEGFIQSLNEGVVWANLIGHGGLDRFAHENVFNRSEVDGLTNLSHLPVLTAFSCVINRADVPGFSSLGEHLVLAPEGGSIVSWASGWVLPHSQSERLGIHFAEAVANQPGQRIGDLILQASLAYQQELGDNADDNARMLPLLYSLIGDPAVRTRF